ncbi:hypothetical protein BJX63DRAFT_420890 [Aspergillus granulosus]|uniref:BZIP domain-containing protein n=1 Tax=Aspergillus granulosus TaxID=176169 RepID=A0ABR4HFY0_9EURO
MSQIPPVSAHSPTDAHPREDRGSLERKRRHAGDENLPDMERRDSVRSRPPSWHPSAPVEPPLSSQQHRSIGVSSILNPPATDGPGVRTGSVDNGREGPGELQQQQQQQHSSDSPSHSRYPSSSTVHLPSPSMHSANPPPALSPGMRSRHQSIAPVSPSSRFVGATGYFPLKAGPGQSPLAQQLPGLQTVAPSSPLPMDPAPGPPLPVSGHHHHAPTHPAPTFANHRASTNQTPTPSSKEASPTTPVSMFSQLGRSSPAIAATSAPQSTPLYMGSSQYAPVDPITRLPAVMGGGPWRSGEETPGLSGPQPETPPLGKIPCFVDLKSGSSSQAEKRKANSDASRRFRNRKRNEMQMEQKITSQQDEIRKQAETIQKQADELRMLMEQREFYRSERDFFREQVTHFVPPAQLPARPTSPKPLWLSSEPTPSGRESSSWATPDVPLKIEGAPSGSTAHKNTTGQHAPASNAPAAPASRTGGSWSATSSAYSGQTERVTPDERQTRPMPPNPGTWNRTT